MTAALVALMALGLVAAIGYPLWKGVKEEAWPAFVGEVVVQDGVAYASREELALDRALGRVGDGSDAVAVEEVDLEQSLEQRVAALRRQRQVTPSPAPVNVSGPAVTVSGSCSHCGYAYDVGDRFCVRCGTSLTQVCPECGHPFDTGDQFCAKCGQKLQVEP